MITEMIAIDWAAWHRPYDDPNSPLSARLDVVRQHLRQQLDAAPVGPVTAVSICAGQGRDLLGAMVDHPRRQDVTAHLIEIDPGEAAIASAAARELGLPGVEVVVGDAGHTDMYTRITPADLVVCCGVFGHLSDEDIRRTIDMMPQLCAPGGTVVWTRHRESPDLTGWIRDWFARAGFTETRLDSVGRRAGRRTSEGTAAAEECAGFVIGSHTLTAPPRRLMPATRLFTIDHA